MSAAAARTLADRLFRVGGLRRQVADLEARAAMLRAKLREEESAMLQDIGSTIGELLDWPSIIPPEPPADPPTDPVEILRQFFASNRI